MISRLPIKWRLTLWYTSLTVVVLIIFSVAVYIGLERRLSTQLDEDLKSQAALAAGAVTFGQGGAILEVIARDQLSEGAVLWVVDLDGDVPLQVGGSKSDPPGPSDIARANRGSTVFSTVKYDGDSVRTVTVPIRSQQGEIVGALQLGLSNSRIEDALNLLIGALLLIGPIAIVIAAATGYLLAGSALSPVTRITALASQIGGDDLQSRLDLDLPDDEIGLLASTFDSMLDRVEDAFQRQRQFTGDAAHELRTPLALMRSQIDLAVTQAETTAEFQEALIALDGDVGRMTTLVSTLLSLARADAGQLTPNRETVNLADLAGDVAEQLQPIAEENGLTIETSLVPVTVQADADMVIQVMVNLIDNAIKNTPTGGKITLRTRTDGIHATLAVQDTGVGIAPEHVPRIFDRFYRVDSGRARSRGGIGLGLAICQAIATAHHGTLTATSTLGQGTTFTLSIPVN